MFINGFSGLDIFKELGLTKRTEKSNACCMILDDVLESILVHRLLKIARHLLMTQCILARRETKSDSVQRLYPSLFAVRTSCVAEFIC